MMKIRYLSEEQIQKGFDKAFEYSYRDFFICKLLLNTGMRRSEPRKTYPINVDHKQKHILVRGKGKKYRIIDISRNLSERIRSWIRDNNIGPNTPIISVCDETIRNITYRHFDTNPHNLRHTYAINLLKLTKNIRYVQKQLGHSSLKTTSIYLQFMDFDQDKKLLMEI